MELTEAAARQVSTVAEAEGLSKIIRAGVKGGGCSGFQYALFFEEEDSIGEMDNVYETNGIRVVVDPMSLQFLEGTWIDFVQDDLMGLGGGFQFNNPKASAGCGCGMSFTA